MNAVEIVGGVAAKHDPSDRVGRPDSPLRAMRRRVGGHAVLDPFGLDPQLCDLAAPIFRFSMRVETFGAESVPSNGPAVLVMNRGYGVFEPTALTVAIMNETGRRVRVVGAPGLFGVGNALRRFGAIAATAADINAALAAGHLVAIPMAPAWLSPRSGAPPLELMQTVMKSIVLPVAVRPGGPFGAPLAGWRVKIGTPIVTDDSLALGDPLGAAELSETVRTAVDNLR